MNARGEQRSGSFEDNGEAALQRGVIESTAAAEPFVVFDIGANTGEWTARLLNSLPSERVAPARLQIHAFEPVPATAELFRAHVAGLPGGDCVTLHNVAISSEQGRAKIGIYGAGAGTNTLHYLREPRGEVVCTEVELTTLAAFCAQQEIEHIHLAKCDAEGHDAHILQGVRSLLLSSSIDVFQFEYNHRWVFGGSFLKDVFDLVHDLPYELARVDKNHLTVFRAWHPEIERFFQSNYVLVHERALHWFVLRRGHFDAANTYA